MPQPPLKCNQLAVKEIYDHLTVLDQSGAFPQGLNLDSGYRKLNYRDSFKPEGTVEGKGDGGVSCEETWENGLQALDTLGELAKWEEDPAETNDSKAKHAIERYQEFRKLIERNTRRPVFYVLEAPHHETYPGERVKRLKEAKEIRNKTNQTIQKLNELLKQEKLDPTQRQRCLIACLYWFVLVGGDGRREPLDDQGNLQLPPFLIRQGINKGTANKIIDQFAKYLQQSGAGLGLIKIGQNRNEKSDADMEATALETILKRKGWCTEQSKVMYAVLRMAGIEAFFVEPRLSVEYSLAKDRQPHIPLLSHMASGVGVKILDESGKESAWIVDVGLKLLEADYIKESPGQWETHPYWELSLRHFFMADLSNLGLDQTNQNNFLGAKQSFETALDLGVDSTAFHVMGNYAYLLSIKAEQLSCHSRDNRKICKDLDKDIDRYSKEAVEINPNNPLFLFNRGQYLLYKQAWTAAVATFLKSIDADPRYILPYQKLRKVIYEIPENGPDEFSDVRKGFIEQIPEIVARHPLLKKIIQKRVEEMKPRKKPLAKLSHKDKKVIELIEELKKISKL